MIRAWISRIATALVFAAAAGVLLVGARRALSSGSPREKVSRMLWNQMVPSRAPVAADRLRLGTRRHELVGVLIATSECIGTRNPDFVPAVRAMKGELARRAAAQGKSLRLVGVALDEQVSDGMMMLSRIGPFDEISVGGNWLNSNAVAYIWRTADRSTSIPQWVVLERDVAVDPAAIGVTPDRIVAVVSGADRMRAWIRASESEVRASARTAMAP